MSSSRSTCQISRLITLPSELNQLTGIAAILTYPLDVDIVEAEEQELKEEAERAAAEAS